MKIEPNPIIAKRILKARAALLIKSPFFGVLSLRLKFEPMTDVQRQWFYQNQMRPTLMVNGTHVFYAEDYIENIEQELVESAVAHEVMHCVYDHMSRRQHRDHKAWIAACDFVVNQTLKDAGFPLGDKWLYDPKYAGWSADQIYNSFPPGDKNGNGSGQTPQDQVADGTTDPSEMAQRENDWKVATMQAAATAKGQGKLPASLERFVEQLTETKTDWRDRLRRFVTERTREDYNWTKPNRRFIVQELYFPSLYSEAMGTVVIVSDDSGSITDKILQAFGSETAAVRNAVRPQRTIVMSCDAAVNHVDDLGPDDELKLKNHGGGGTDFRPPFEWLAKRGIKPACLIYLTDLYGSFPDKAPDFPVLWCCINDQQAPWGETVKIEVDE